MNKIFAENLRRLRLAAGIKKASELAAKASIPYSRYMNFENKGYEPSYSDLCQIATALNTTPNELIGFGQASLNDIAIRQWALFGFHPGHDEDGQEIMSDDLLIYPVNYTSPSFYSFTQQVLANDHFQHSAGTAFIEACQITNAKLKREALAKAQSSSATANAPGVQ